ncbi:hypothetical protein [Candidatus Electronema sp. PJ]|uniref:hypothetical protein n=1 Tax=Candidatus Electronema sp. PJ TaxID=3401572 RepID=UPI003AA8B765
MSPSYAHAAIAAMLLPPTQQALELYEKAQQVYLPAGIQSVWIVQPLAHTIAVLTSGAVKLHHDGILEDQNLSIDLRVIFED